MQNRQNTLKPHRPARSAPHRSESTEDHLERIQELIERKGYARVTDIALALGLSRSAVSNTVRRLAERGFLNYEKYRGFTLTPAGRHIADHIRARHETVGELLRLLGLDPETIRREVEGIEHHLDAKTLAAFDKLVAFWRTHPTRLQEFREFKPRAQVHRS